MGAKSKYFDKNGFLHLPGTPISRVQIAPYLGKQIDAKGVMDLDPPLLPKDIYPVYRSAKALFNKDTMESFNGMPFRVGHQMLGKGAGKIKSVDDSPADGCFFNVRRDEDRPDYLVADIVIYTEKAVNAIANGTKELSLGYRCRYVPVDSYPKPEYHEGHPYLFRQENIIANHLALVPHGRAGSSVCVQDEAIAVEDELVVTCDSLPEEIQIMEKDEKKAQQKLVELLNGSEEDIQNCLDYCDFTEAQKAKIKEMKSGKEEAPAEAEDKACKCKTADCGDQKPPVPPPVKEAEEEGAKEDVKEEAKEETPAPADPAPAAEPSKEEAEKPAEAAPAPAQDCGEAEDAKPKCCFTQDEFDKACDAARKEGFSEGLKKGRQEGQRAQFLAEAVGEDATDKSEGDVARAACKKIKGLEFAQDASDDVAIAAIRGHLETLKRAKEETKEEPKPAPKAEPKPAPAKPSRKTFLSVPTQDEAIAKTHVSFQSDKFTTFLADN